MISASRPKYLLTAKGRELVAALIAAGDRHYPIAGGPPRPTLHRGGSASYAAS